MTKKKSTEAQTEFLIPASMDVQEVLKKARETFYMDDNVIGVGIGPRRVNKQVHP
jgi:hypothetical protein